MPKTYKIETYESLEKERNNTKDKQTDKRLRAVQLHYAGKTNKEIAEQLETSSDMISRCSEQLNTSAISFKKASGCCFTYFSKASGEILRQVDLRFNGSRLPVRFSWFFQFCNVNVETEKTFAVSLTVCPLSQ